MSDEPKQETAMTVRGTFSVLVFVFAIAFSVLMFTTDYSPIRSNVITGIAIALIIWGSALRISKWINAANSTDTRTHDA
jgi:hypothetical protein